MDVAPIEIPWDIVPFEFQKFDWTWTEEEGWVPYCWLDEDHFDPFKGSKQLWLFP